MAQRCHATTDEDFSDTPADAKLAISRKMAQADCNSG